MFALFVATLLILFPSVACVDVLTNISLCDAFVLPWGAAIPSTIPNTTIVAHTLHDAFVGVGNKSSLTFCLASRHVAQFDSLWFSDLPDAVVNLSLVGFGGVASLQSGGFLANDAVDSFYDIGTRRGVLALRDLEFMGHFSLAFNGTVSMERVAIAFAHSGLDDIQVGSDLDVVNCSWVGVSLRIFNIALKDGAAFRRQPVSRVSWSIRESRFDTSRLEFVASRVTGYNSSDPGEQVWPSMLSFANVSFFTSAVIAAAETIVLSGVTESLVLNQIRAVDLTVLDSVLDVSPSGPCLLTTSICRAPPVDSFGYSFVGLATVASSYIAVLNSVNATNVFIVSRFDETTMPVFVDLRAEDPIDVRSTPTYTLSNVSREDDFATIVCPPTIPSFADASGFVCHRCAMGYQPSSNGTSCVQCPSDAALCGVSPGKLCQRGYRQTRGECKECELGLVWNGVACECPPNMARVRNFQAEALGLLSCASLNDTCADGVVLFDFFCLSPSTGGLVGGVALALALIVGCVTFLLARRCVAREKHAYARLDTPTVASD